ncbi:hypothetical protein LTR36_007859 [Oleoguttula mirabilis]|uniref:GST N-terminal domain-containing protein n=1 Tax=Oleoguttula mirabilis TaxID=1507867 RepID=A0AAV9J8Y3_9PEZI|nr:hypothetical protein LTR36_007859 [Oleoguttula mirabilis]
MSNNDELILYDLARRGHCTSWSFNPWKTRLVLNYKSIPYRTEWLDHQTIAPTLTGLGVPPNTSSQGGSEYTVPTVRFKDGTYLRDSAAIAEKLEAMFPDQPLLFDPETQLKAEQAIGKVAGPLVPVFVPRIAQDVITETSVPSFREPRLKVFGMTLEELESVRGGEQAWKAAETGTQELKAVLTEHKRSEGPFILGSEVSYADFIVVAFFESLRRIGSDVGERVLGFDESFRRLHEACGEWMEKDA